MLLVKIFLLDLLRDDHLGGCGVQDDRELPRDINSANLE